MDTLVVLVELFILVVFGAFLILKLDGDLMFIKGDKEEKMLKKYKKKNKDLKVLNKKYFSDRTKVVFEVIDNLEDYADEVEAINQLQNSILLYLNCRTEGSVRSAFVLPAYEDLVLNAYRNVKRSRGNAREDLVDMTDKALSEAREESARLNKEEA